MNQTESYLTQSIVGTRQRMSLGVRVRYEGGALLPIPQSSWPLSGFITLILAKISDIFAAMSGRVGRGPVLLTCTVLVGMVAAASIWSTQRPSTVSVVPATNGETVVAVPGLPILPFSKAPADGVATSGIALNPSPFPVEDSAATNGPAVGLPFGAPPNLPGIGNIPTEKGPLPPQSVPPGAVAALPQQMEPFKLGEPRATSVVGERRSQAGKSEPDQKRVEEPPRALVLDVGRESPDKPAAAKPVKQEPGVVTRPSVTGRPSTLVEPVHEVSGAGNGGRSARSGSPPPTIVDIAKDGSYVLITNPVNRLPQKFQVGQQIPSGGTVQRIDHAKGVVQIDGQSYGLQ